MSSQRDRVLALLRARGDQGLNTTDLHAPTCDGEKPIIRLAGRICELRDRGFQISTVLQQDGTATYRLVGEPVEQASGGRAADHISAGLTSAEPVLFSDEHSYRDVA